MVQVEKGNPEHGGWAAIDKIEAFMPQPETCPTIPNEAQVTTITPEPPTSPATTTVTQPGNTTRDAKIVYDTFT